MKHVFVLILSIFNVFFLYAENIDSLLNVIQQSEEVNHAQIYNSISSYYIRKDVSKSISYSKKAKKIALKHKQTEQIIQADLNMGYVFLVTGNIDSANLLFRKSLNSSKKINNTYYMATSFNRIGVLNYFFKNTDSAEFYFNNALQLFHALNDEIELVKIYNNLGAICYSKKKYNESLSYFLKCVDLDIKLKNESSLSSDYNNISAIYANLFEYNKGIDYALKGLSYSLKYNDIKAEINAKINLGNLYKGKKEFNKAIRYSLSAEKLSKKNSDLYNLAIIYNNLSTIYSNLLQYDSAYFYIQKSYDIKKNISNEQNLISTIGNMGGILTYQKKYVDAKKMLVKANNLAMKHKEYDYLLNQLQNLAIVYSNLNQHDSVQFIMNQLRLYYDSANKMKFDTIFHELEAKYQTAKKEEQINTQQKILEKEKKIKILYISIFVLAAIILVIIIIVNKIKSKNKTQLLIKEEQKIALKKVLEAEEKERGRIAKDLHDGVVQDLTFLKLKINSIIESKTEKNNNQLQEILENLDQASKDIRDISYQMMPVVLKEHGLVKALEDLFQRASLYNIIKFDFKKIGDIGRFNESLETNIYRICQELMNNSIKHSGAKNVNLLILLKDNYLTLTFEDDGNGFNIDNVNKGIGLNSLSSRINMINGSFEMDSKHSKGTACYLRIPIIK